MTGHKRKEVIEGKRKQRTEKPHDLYYVLIVFFFLLALQPPSGVVFYSPLAGFSLLAYEVTWSHTKTRHSRQDSSERMISPSQRPLTDNTQHSQQTNIHALGGIRTHNLSRRAAEDLRLRPRGHWDRRPNSVMATKLPRMEGGRAYIWMTNPSKYHEAGRKKRLEKICVEGRTILNLT